MNPRDVASIILHNNGGVYFKTDKTCSPGSVWCIINYSDAKQIDRAYSALLAAQASMKKITFYWPNLSSCSDINNNGARPDYLFISK